MVRTIKNNKEFETEKKENKRFIPNVYFVIMNRSTVRHRLEK